jgi:hypothetical protein
MVFAIHEKGIKAMEYIMSPDTPDFDTWEITQLHT